MAFFNSKLLVSQRVMDVHGVHKARSPGGAPHIPGKLQTAFSGFKDQTQRKGLGHWEDVKFCILLYNMCQYMYIMYMYIVMIDDT